ncbi:hypothetical protein [Streptomyces rhizosphaericus]|uniref:hypothetical protein n=1 Tax=Streptomyces rhizosphaericus TaxID=114699 RepID=UPI000A380371|nr:hypothetical protein [Streptomyces rhizosphaericus]
MAIAGGAEWRRLQERLRAFALRCSGAALALDAEADACDREPATWMRREAEAAWRAAGLARAWTEAAVAYASAHERFPAELIERYGAILGLPALQEDLAQALARFDALTELGGGVASADAAGLTGPLLAARGGATPQAAIALRRELERRQLEPATGDQLAAVHAQALVNGYTGVGSQPCVEQLVRDLQQAARARRMLDESRQGSSTVVHGPATLSPPPSDAAHCASRDRPRAREPHTVRPRDTSRREKGRLGQHRQSGRPAGPASILPQETTD